jgi:O-antigen/teichoic acid export membrane protein
MFPSFKSLADRRGGKLVAAGFGSLALRAAGMVATFVLGIQLARYLGPAQFGIYGIVIAVAMLLSAVGQLGLPTLATREVALSWSRRDFPQLRGILRWFFFASLAVSSLLGLAFAMGVAHWPDGTTRQFEMPAMIGAALVPLFALTVLVSAELRSLDRLVLGQSLEILVRPLVQSMLCLAVFVGLRGFDVSTALALNVAASVFALLLALFWLRRELPPEARDAVPQHHARKWLKSAAPLALTDILRQLDGVYALLLMGMLASSYDTGMFRVAQASMMVVAMPLFIVQVIVAPTLARLFERGDHSKLQSLLRTSAQVNFAAALIGLLFVALVGREFLSFAFGSEYVEAWLPLLILCAYLAVVGFFGVGLVLLPMVGAERELTIAFAISIVVSVAVGVVLVSNWGAIGAAFTALVGAAVNGLLANHFARSRTGLGVTAFS